MDKIVPFTRLSARSEDVDLCDKNDNILSMSEVVRRWHDSGQFMMQEVNHSDAYEGKSVEIADSDIIGRISKIESYLMGIHAVNEVKASAPSETAKEKESVTSTEPPKNE